MSQWHILFFTLTEAEVILIERCCLTGRCRLWMSLANVQPMRVPKAPSYQYGYNKNAVIAVLSLWFNIGMSIWYVTHFAPNFANDLLLPEYNTTGYHNFLIDCINKFLEFSTNISLSHIVMEASYNSPSNTAKVHPSYPMNILLNRLTSIEYAIVNLRNTTPFIITYLPTQYCWVDVNQTWELAHSFSRQQRCREKYFDNGAVYLETILRNINWHVFFTPANMKLWNDSLFNGLTQSARGLHWLQHTSYVNTTIADEMAYWKRFRIIKYQLQWQDFCFPALEETVYLTNAIGIKIPILVKSTPARGGPSTSTAFSSYVAYDFFVGQYCNGSILPNASNFYINKYCNGINATSIEVFAQLDFNGNFTDQRATIREVLGPFLSTDLWVIPVPASLANLVATLFSCFYQTIMANNDMAMMYAALQSIVTTPHPPTWNEEYFYYGGNPFCLQGTSKSFVQTLIAFDDECTEQLPLTLTLTPISVVIALYLTNEVTTIERICSLQTASSCPEELKAAYQLMTAFPIMPYQTAVTAVNAINVSLIQYATNINQSEWMLLAEPLLGNSPWNFYGWIMLLDWVQGTREVISMEGDFSTITLISEVYATESDSNNMTTITQASTIAYYIFVYFSALIALLGLFCTIASYKCQYGNLLFFHRIVGSTWIGRPIMFLRGAAALVLLSSAPVRLEHTHSLTKLDLSPRSYLETAILSMEATWVAAVVHELIVPFTSQGARRVGTISVCLAWLVCFTIDIFLPIELTTQFDYDCHAVDMISQLYCTSGSIHIGSLDRMNLLVGMQCMLVVVLALINHQLLHRQVQLLDTMTISGVGRAFILPPLDILGSILDGVLPYSSEYVFDIKLWSTIPTCATIHLPIVASADIPTRLGRISFVKMIIGIAYIVAIISSSISYLQLLEMNLSNDLGWTTFNISGAHILLSTWFLEGFPFYSKSQPVQLSELNAYTTGNYNISNPAIPFSTHIGAHRLYTELTTMSSVIVALRNLDACEAPWLFTQYCYLDFEKRWEMANSVRRQERCSDMTSNAAIFLEATLRNIDWNVFLSCWGSAFNIAFGNELELSQQGIKFLQNLYTHGASVTDEVNYWKRFNVVSYTLQWQNFKYIGAILTYTISNANSASYPFIMASTLGKYRQQDQTSYKMYWALANDFACVVNNKTLIGGKSLLRSSAQFAFANTTLQNVYMHSSIIDSPPWSPNYIAQESFFGPFGSIDMIYIGVPDMVKQVALKFLLFTQEMRLHEFHTDMNNLTNFISIPSPKLWIDINLTAFGGSVLCPNQQSDASLRLWLGMDPSFRFDASCDTASISKYNFIAPTPNHAIFATIFANLSESTNISALCYQTIYTADYCEATIYGFLQLLHGQAYKTLYNLWASSLYESIYSLNIEWMQYGQVNVTSPIQIYHTPVLDKADRTFDFFAWYALYDWFIGNTEVVSFQGDNGNLTILGNTMALHRQSVIPNQLPIVLSLFAQRGVQYVTFVIIALAFITCMYVCHSRGRVEGLNMLKLGRVGGIVWIGRPLVFLRSLTALCLLSTANIQHSVQNGTSYFATVPKPWYETCLAANEVTWLAEIVNDLIIIYTKAWTRKYATANNILIWTISACLATLTPVEPKITIDPKCQIDTLDFQIVCNLGNVTIGSYHRLLVLCGVVILSNCICFSVARLIWKNPCESVSSSSFLSGGARFLFQQESWRIDGIYYMDTASAALNGLLSYRFKQKWYVFDVKTWRLHILDHQCSDQWYYRALPLKDY